MPTTFIYGDNHTCSVELPNCSRLALANERSRAIDDPAAAVRKGLAAPRGFPPLALATAPGDTVAIALADGVPEIECIAAGAVAGLMDAGVEPDHVTIVAEKPIAGRDRLDERLAEIGAGDVRFEVHDPDDEEAIAMVGVSKEGAPLKLNRTIAEADFILPIALCTPPDGGRAKPKFAGLFPQFSNRDTIIRMRSQGASESMKQQRKWANEIDEADWKLGVSLVVCIVPAGGGGVAEVLAGAPANVAEASSEHLGDSSEASAIAPGDMVIATIAGDQREQTWPNLARALKAAEPLLEDGGAAVVYSELSEAPEGPFDLLCEAVDFAEVARELSLDPHADAQAAIVLARALDRGPVYLRSDLPADVVESIGMAPIESDDELSRLASQRQRCVLIEQAQRRVATLQEYTS
jgi:lactate racemase